MATGHIERWPSRRPARHVRRWRRWRSGARLVSSVAIVSVVWFTSTSWRRDQILEPYTPRRLGRSASEPTRRLRAEWEQRPKAFLPKGEAPPREECCRHLEGVGKV